MKIKIPLFLSFSLACVQQLSAQTPAPVAKQAPQVVETSPKAWQIGANQSQKEVSVTFDQKMSPAFTAWIGRSSLVPQLDLDSKITPDRRTFSLHVDLQPAKVYVFALNEKNIPGVGFQNEIGVSVPPYYLVFQTTGTPAPDDAPPRVVTTNPVNGAQKVDTVRVKAVSVTFDKAMQVAKHGMHMRENQKEVDLSKARFQYAGDGKSFTLAYDFKPASTYEFELNSVHDIGFASAKRVPLWPVKFAFSTQ